MDTHTILHNELKGSFDFFVNFTNLDPASPGFGLTVDSTKTPEVASIASVGAGITHPKITVMAIASLASVAGLNIDDRLVYECHILKKRATPVTV